MPQLLCNVIRGWEFKPEMEGLRGREDCECSGKVVEPGREMVPKSCGSWSKGVPGGSKSSSAPASPPAVAGRVLRVRGSGAAGSQVMLEQDRRC